MRILQLVRTDPLTILPKNDVSENKEIFKRSLINNFFSAIRAFIHLELMRAEELIENWYEIQRNLYLQVAHDFILEQLKNKLDLNTHSPNNLTSVTKSEKTPHTHKLDIRCQKRENPPHPQT